jgi:DNA-directed RNA polymerase subunit H
MLEARGADPRDIVRQDTESELTLQSATMTLVVIGPDDQRRKVGINDVRHCFERWPGRHLVMVSGGGGTPYLMARVCALEDEYGVHISVFTTQSMYRDINDHSLVPRHTKMEQGEIDTLLSVHGVRSADELPKLLRTDPVAMFHDWRPGAVILIQRRELMDSGLVQHSVAARIVV